MVLTSERVEKRPGATLAAFPPPIFAGTTSVSVFRVYPPPPDRDRRGGLFIGFLGQTEHLDAKMNIIGGPKLKRA
jgi:hypothetical protein